MQPFPGTGDTSPRLRGVIGGPARSASFCDDQDDDDDDDGDDGGDGDDDGGGGGGGGDIDGDEDLPQCAINMARHHDDGNFNSIVVFVCLIFICCLSFVHCVIRSDCCGPMAWAE